MTELEALLERAATLAAEAGHAIMGVRTGGFTVQRKADNSMVTAADTLAEAIITEGLRDTGIPVVAEEAVADGAMLHATPRYWLVDPLDGTREFAADRDEFAVCIGLVEHGVAVLGAMCLPATEEIYGGILPMRLAWRQHDGKRHAIAARRCPPEGLTVLGSRSHGRAGDLGELLAGQQVAHTQPMGSAMKFARLAEGAADVLPRTGPTMEWDTAAGQALVEAAGGRVLTLDGTPLRYGKPGWRNSGFIAWGAA